MKLGDVVPIVLSSTSILFAVVAFLHGWKTRALRDGSAHSLVFLWKRAGAAGAIPMAITLIICSAKPSLLAYTPGLGLPIALGGLSLLYICVEALTAPESKPPENTR